MLPRLLHLFFDLSLDLSLNPFLYLIGLAFAGQIIHHPSNIYRHTYRQLQASFEPFSLCTQVFFASLLEVLPLDLQPELAHVPLIQVMYTLQKYICQVINKVDKKGQDNAVYRRQPLACPQRSPPILDSLKLSRDSFTASTAVLLAVFSSLQFIGCSWI
ncbi:hypothetical protein F5Y07DRAFT_38538 [Xylaria sp. FL0933]|nr:hypothetical protein F5Y07DRAFT_38538 [Xylaria sp. FL0933]